MQFIDLKRQQALIRDDIDRRLARLMDHGQYILGPEIGEHHARKWRWSKAFDFDDADAFEHGVAPVSSRNGNIVPRETAGC